MKRRTVCIIIILILGYFLVIVKGWQPVAFVGWRPIFKHGLDTEIAAYERAYQAGSLILPELQSGTSTAMASSVLRLDRKKILEKLIREEIIEAGAKSLNIADLEGQIEKEINGSLGGESREKLEKSLNALYNWNLDEFREFYLRPKALKELIALKLQDSDRSFADWFAGVAGQIKVRMLIPGYRWDTRLDKIF